MKIKNLLLPVVIVFSFSACKKEAPQTNPLIDNVLVSEFLPFTVGNYWIYDVYKVNDTTGLEELLDVGDTVRIIAEEIINNETYFSFEQKQHWISTSNEKDTVFLRD